uniref:Methyltransferase type 11 domain-containing protein n=1 Tax=Kalanchoe fedtschenkoi TaxID=63787 RepID=A0A7N0TX25_KALFE
MAHRLQLLLHCPPPLASSVNSKLVKNIHRRLLLGIGVSSSLQLTNLDGRGSLAGFKSFVASAAQKSAYPVEEILKNVNWPENFPFREEDFQRFDETPDTVFYESPRFVTHIDDPAISVLTKYYSMVFPPSHTPGISILDMCSSWVSHFATGYKQERIVGMGLNEQELKRNPVLTEYIVQDLNVKPILPFEDNSFDVITNVVSVDYLTKPLEVFKEMARILKALLAISIWTSTGDADHIMIVGSYFHYAGGCGQSDPMYIVCSRKL